MINFEDIVEFLAAKGVKSLHIEMQPVSALSATLASTDEQAVLVDGKVVVGRPLTHEQMNELKDMRGVLVPAPQPGKHDIPVHRGPEEIVPTGASPLLVALEEKAPGKTVPVLPNPDLLGAVTSVFQQPKQEPKQEPVKDEPKAEKPKKEAKPKKETKPAPETPAAAEVKAENLYEAFGLMITADDGKYTAADRIALINRMALDDLLRVNNDFSLALDTDVPWEILREDVAKCFE